MDNKDLLSKPPFPQLILLFQAPTLVAIIENTPAEQARETSKPTEDIHYSPLLQIQSSSLIPSFATETATAFLPTV